MPVRGKLDGLLDDVLDLAVTNCCPPNDGSGISSFFRDAFFLRLQNFEAHRIGVVGRGVLLLFGQHSLQSGFLGRYDLLPFRVVLLSCLSKDVAQPLDALGRQPDSAVALFNLGLDLIDREVRRFTTLPIIATTAEEILVGVAVPIGDLLIVEALTAAFTKDRALQIVIMGAVPGV